jgi:hypothetical protein
VRQRRTWVWGAVVALAFVVFAGSVAAWVGTDDPTEGQAVPDTATAGAAGAPPPVSLPATPEASAIPATELIALLQRREAAALDGEAAAFLRTVSNRSVRDLEQQRVLAGNLSEVGFSRWTHTLGPEVEGDDITARRLKDRLGQDALVVRVDLAYRVRGYDLRTVESERVMAFVEDGGTWKVGADVDTGAFRSPWDVTPVTAYRGESALVLNASTSVSGSELQRISDAAVESVNSFWGRDWDRRVVVIVPASQKQLGTLLRREADRYDNLSAVATSELSGDSLAGAANRVWVNPGTWGRVTPVGRQIVLRHEITHVATGAAVPSAFPIWLEEGLAEYIGYRGSGVASSIVAQDLFEEVRSGEVPADLPDREGFGPTSPDLSLAYQGSWWAMRVIEARGGSEAVLGVYRAALDAPDPETADEFALQQVLGVSREEFVREWQQSLRAQAAR